MPESLDTEARSEELDFDIVSEDLDFDVVSLNEELAMHNRS